MHASDKHVAMMWRTLACDIAGVADEWAEADRSTGLKIKAAINPAKTTTTGWAAELVKVTLAEFITQLEPISLAGSLFNGSGALVFPRPAGSMLKVPGRAATPTVAGAFVGEDDAIPVRKAAFTAPSLGPHKMAVISTFTREMANAAPAAFEDILRKIILEDTADALDAVLVDNVAASSIRPAGLANGAVVVTPAPAGADSATTDIGALINAIQPATRIGLIAHPSQAFTIASLFLGEMAVFVNLYPTKALAEGTVIAVDLDSIAASADLPQFAVSNEAVLHEEDTAPSDIGTAGTPNVVAAPSRSLWQTATLAVRMIWWITWIKRRTGATAIVTATNW